jgi:hypothetical protein
MVDKFKTAPAFHTETPLIDGMIPDWRDPDDHAFIYMKVQTTSASTIRTDSRDLVYRYPPIFDMGRL